MNTVDKVPLLDLHAQFRALETDIRAAIDRVLASQHFILGPEVEALEKEIAPYVGCKHAIGVSSGSDALLMTLMALGVGKGDEVITSPFTFFATGGAIARLGAKTVFVDIEPTTYNIDPRQMEKAFTSRTKAVIPVHLFGQAADLGPIVDMCAKRNVPIIEDAAQAIGTEYQGKRIGEFGLMSCFSFFPSKNLGAMGDAGLVTTNDDAMGEKLRILRAHGSKPKYYHRIVGGNFRIDAIQAAVLRVKFKHLDSWTAGRQKNAGLYDRKLKDAGLLEFVTPPWRRSGDRHIFNQYVIRTKRRDELKKHLTESGIGTEIYYPLSLHEQECFADLGYKRGDFPESERAAAESLAVPVYPELTEAQVDRVVAVMRGFFGR